MEERRHTRQVRTDCMAGTALTYPRGIRSQNRGVGIKYAVTNISSNFIAFPLVVGQFVHFRRFQVRLYGLVLCKRS